MPDADGKSLADEETTPDTPLHAYREGREEDMKGDTERYLSNDRTQQQHRKVEDADEELHAPEKR